MSTESVLILSELLPQSLIPPYSVECESIALYRADHGRKKQLKRVSTTRCNSTEAAVDIL